MNTLFPDPGGPNTSVSRPGFNTPLTPSKIFTLTFSSPFAHPHGRITSLSALNTVSFPEDPIYIETMAPSYEW